MNTRLADLGAAARSGFIKRGVGRPGGRLRFFCGLRHRPDWVH
ncbi:hypothetical protein [Aquabacterium sp. NJ1]